MTRHRLPMSRGHRGALGAALVGAAACAVLSAGPLRYPLLESNQIRIEGHLLPAVSTGPLDPAWSPDGQWIAFSMKGDIWKVPAAGGEAIALTEGPGYHFEPVWSPDGKRLALSMDLGGNLDIGIVNADGGTVDRVTTDKQVDVEPTWSPDGRTLYFTSGRNGNLDIFSVDVASKTQTPVVVGHGDQFQPAVSPDGRSLAYISPVKGEVGEGGIWVMPLPSGSPKLIRSEETSFRTKPAWTPNGKAFVYVSDESGPNHVASIPTGGGTPVYLTNGGTDEYAPTVSPNGTTVAFVSNRKGPTELFTMPLGGAREDSWKKVEIRSLHPRTPRGTLRVTVNGPDGRRTPARIQIVASDGRAYTPDGSFHRVNSSTETHYFHTDGAFEEQVPTGPLDLEVLKGTEYQVSKQTVQIAAGGTAEVTVNLQRLVDLPAQGWYSGDDHIHDLHQGRWGLTHEYLMLQLQAEDIHVTNALIHMDGTRLMGRWGDLTGKPDRVSTPGYILFYGEEYRGNHGHVGLLGINHFIMPLIGGVPDTVDAIDPPEGWYMDEARKQGGLGGFVHPYGSRVTKPTDSANSELAFEAGLGKGDFYDISSIVSDEVATTEMYYRFLNAGIRMPATGGSDNFSNVWRDSPPGTSRGYAHVQGPFTYASWIAAVKAGHTFGTNGPLITLDVNGKEPGDEIRVDGATPASFTVHTTVKALAPLEKIEIIVNGVVVHTEKATGDGKSISATATVPMPKGGWIAARALGPSHRYFPDSYACAQTTPVYIVRNGKTFTSAADASFLAAMVDEFWRLEDAANHFNSAAEKEAYHAQVQRARDFYQRAAAAAGGQ